MRKVYKEKEQNGLVSLEDYRQILRPVAELVEYHKDSSLEELRDMFAEYYEGEKFIKVMPYGAEAEEGNVLFADACSMWDGMQIFVTGNEDRLVVATRFDNLGKGASGAAVQCMNIVMGVDEATGLNL